MLNALLTRWARTRGALSSTFFARSTQTASPKLGKDTSLWTTILRRNEGAAESPAPEEALNAARAHFEASLHGLQGEQVEELTKSIRRSRELEDLWHLRTWLYNEVARQFSQYEAEQRLALLQPHFASH